MKGLWVAGLVLFLVCLTAAGLVSSCIVWTNPLDPESDNYVGDGGDGGGVTFSGVLYEDGFFSLLTAPQYWNGANGFAVDGDTTEKHAGTTSFKVDWSKATDWNAVAVSLGSGHTPKGTVDLSGYDALTFWAKASAATEIDKFGFGADESAVNTNGTKYEAYLLNQTVTTTWTKYIIPLPAPAKLIKVNNLFYAVDGAGGGTIYLDDIKFEELGNVSVKSITYNGSGIDVTTAGTATQIDDLAVVFTDGTNDITNVNFTNLAAYITWTSSDDTKATVDENGVTGVAAGTATITAKLGEKTADIPVTVTARTPVYVIVDGLIVELLFNGNANDTSQNGNHGIVYGATLTTDRFGNANSAYSFDGNDRITLPEVVAEQFLQTEYSLSFFYQRTGSNSNSAGNDWQRMFWSRNIIDIFILNNPGGVNVQSNSLYVNIPDNSIANNFYIGNYRELNTNYYFTLVKLSDRIKVYINGNLVKNEPIDYLVKTSTINELTIGLHSDSNLNGFVGKIDDIRIYNRALSEDEIQTLFFDVSSIPDGFVLVEGGTFTMGSPESESGRDSDEVQHQVTVSSFYMSKYEVTQAQYLAVMGSNPSDFSGDNKPVEKVSWYDAVNFCNKLSEDEGLEKVYTINSTDVTANWTKKGYRLPTEAEWEYAARGGKKSKGYLYSGSDTVGDVAWYKYNSESKTHEVGTKAANELGLYDMSGNVYEWCWDWKGDYSSGSQTDPVGPSIGSNRVLRGGSWNFSARDVRVADRDNHSPGYSSDIRGFRLVLPAI